MTGGLPARALTTGRGTPSGLADLAHRWHDLMDVDAGRIADGTAMIDSEGWELFGLMLDVASGTKTWTERWKLHNALVLFNPAPAT